MSSVTREKGPEIPDQRLVQVFQQVAKGYPKVRLSELNVPAAVQENYEKFRERHAFFLPVRDILAFYGRILSGRVQYKSSPPDDRNVKGEYEENKKTFREARMTLYEDPYGSVIKFLKFSLRTNYFETQAEKFHMKFLEHREALSAVDRQSLDEMHLNILRMKDQMLAEVRLKSEKIQINSSALAAELETMKDYLSFVVKERKPLKEIFKMYANYPPEESFKKEVLAIIHDTN